MSSTTKPVTPSSTTSGTEPQRQPITGVPHAIASIMTRPKGSGQSMGNSSARAPHRKALLSASPISPTNSIRGSFSRGWISRRKYSLSAGSTLAAMRSAIPAALAISMARSGRFSGEMRPRKAR